MNGRGQAYWRVTVDGGGETWPTLVEIVGRRLDQMAVGDILHIISREPTTSADIAEWCASAGHALILVQQDTGDLRLWIRKEGGRMTS